MLRGDEMANQIGERYICSDPNCGCEVEIVLPSRPGAESGRGNVGKAAPLTARLSPDVFTPPSKTMPRERPSLQEGAGERSSEYGSPKVEDELPGAFRDEEETEETAPGPATESARAARSQKMGSLVCFCGSLMVLTDARSSAARVGRPI